MQEDDMGSAGRLNEEAMLAKAVAELRRSTASTLQAVDEALERIDNRERAMAEQEAAALNKPAGG